MKRARLVWIIAGLAALVAFALVIFLPNQCGLSVARLGVEQLPEGQAILANAGPESQSIQMGDAFTYLVEVLYDPAKVSEIDGDSLDDNMNLEPFERRDTKETEFNLDSGTRVYQRQYQIQLIDGKTESLYEFPTIVVRYRLRGIEGFAETSATPEPIYVTSRLPADVDKLISSTTLDYNPLRPLKGEIDDASKSHLPWILLVLGGFLAAIAVVDISLRVIPQWRGEAKQTRGMDGVLCQAYRSLFGNVAAGAKPKGLLHQIDHILRLVLAQKERVGWLEEPDPNLVSPEIKPSVISLFEKCQEAYGTENIKQEDVEEALKQLDEVLEFYFGGEVEAWKS